MVIGGGIEPPLQRVEPENIYRIGQSRQQQECQNQSQLLLLGAQVGIEYVQKGNQKKKPNIHIDVPAIGCGDEAEDPQNLIRQGKCVPGYSRVDQIGDNTAETGQKIDHQGINEFAVIGTGKTLADQKSP